MIIKKILFGIVFLALAAGQAIAGPLTNVTVTGTFNAGGFSNGATQVVDPLDFGATFFTEDTNSNAFFFINFDEDGLVTVFNTIGDFVSPPNQIFTFSFSGLDPSDSIIGVSPVDGLALSILNSDTIKINLSSVAFGDEFSSLSAQLVFGVPEPGTLALLGLGMLSLVGLRRRTV
ncbi:MAG TPA: PEP-CTERM sorting domain-containing protein [Rhodocyclaceae bacterium]|nr:PEP-CTERM sorting domain-containing protein [Rhodocyclaceae bacterium]